MRKRRAALLRLSLVLTTLTFAALAACSGSAPETVDQSRTEELIRIGGSDDVYPLARTLALEFEKQNVGYHIAFSPPAHTRGGVAGVAVGELDIGLVSRPLKPEERERQLTHLHLAEDVVVVAVHRDVPVRRLTSQQLLDIYRGTIKSWQEVGGHDQAIVVLDRAEHTSLKITMRQQLFGEELQVTSIATVLERPADMVTSLGLVKGAIGYLSLGDAILEGLDAAVVSIDGIEPRPASVKTRGYPYSRPLGLVVGPQPSESAMQLIKFVYSDQGQRIIEGHGFLQVTMDLVIAALPEQDLLAQEQRYSPLIEYLSQQLGMQTTVKLRLLPNYGEVIKELKTGRVNAAFLGSMAFALAAAQVGIEPIGRPEKDGVSQYRGLIVTRRDSGITDWKGLQGKRFGMVDKGTTAGYIFPLIYFRRHGIDHPEQFLGEIVYTGSHDLLFLKVHNGELDAGAAKDLMLHEVARSRPEVADELSILETSAPVPNNVFVLTNNLSFPCMRCHALVPVTEGIAALSPPRRAQEVNELLGQILLHLHESPEGRQVLEALGADRFVRTTYEDLEEVNRMIREAGFDPESYQP
jgi:phosphate/phosphite/phosphonate ABC transporter binding protein